MGINSIYPPLSFEEFVDNFVRNLSGHRLDSTVMPYIEIFNGEVDKMERAHQISIAQYAYAKDAIVQALIEYMGAYRHTYFR